MMTRVEQWIMAWAHIADAVVCILTLTLWRPYWTINVTLWSLRRRCERAQRWAVECGFDGADGPDETVVVELSTSREAE